MLALRDRVHSLESHERTRNNISSASCLAGIVTTGALLSHSNIGFSLGVGMLTGAGLNLLGGTLLHVRQLCAIRGERIAYSPAAHTEAPSDLHAITTPGDLRSLPLARDGATRDMTPIV